MANYQNLKEVNKFTDLKQVTADYLWDNFDCHYNCVDTLPCYVSEDWTLIINPAWDILQLPSSVDDDEYIDWRKCWCFEWAAFDDDDNLPYPTDFIAGYYYESPWQAFRDALRLRDEYLNGTIDMEHVI